MAATLPCSPRPRSGRRSRTWPPRRPGRPARRGTSGRSTSTAVRHPGQRAAARDGCDARRFHCICGRFTVSGRPAHGARDDAETRGARALLAGVEEHLHADADAEERPPAGDGVEGHALQPGGPQRLHATPEGADAGQYDARRRRATRPGSAVSRASAPDPHERLLGRAEVADAVVEDSARTVSRHSTPLVDGTPPPSTRTASRRQRARPLNDASTMWCTLRPRTSVTCRVMAGGGGEADAMACSARLGSNGGVPSGDGLGQRRPPRPRTAGRTGRGRRRRGPRRAGSARWRSDVRRPCRRAPRGTPRRARWRRPPPCGDCRRGGRPWPSP